MDLFERPQSGERSVLVHVYRSGAYDEMELAELRLLADSAGARECGVVTAARPAPDPRFHIGAGKLAEVAAVLSDTGAELVIVNAELTPAQERNLERELKCRVLDRIGLILDLFAQRASTYEGKLQVELAQLRHLSTRLVRGWTHLERQKGGIGLRGPGETQLETDRRLVANRIKRILERLEGVSRRRELSRRARRRSEVPVVSLVGYTNAGKSTLFNALTGAGVLAEDRLFATLDPTLRRMRGPTGLEFLLVDTVGFIGKLPHELVAAFKSTLEETVNADLLLHVVDASDPERALKIGQVTEVLEEIGAGEVPQLIVYNKADLADSKIGELGDSTHLVAVSALLGEGLEELGSALEANLTTGDLHLRLSIPFEASRVRAALFQETRVLCERADGERGWELDIAGSTSVIERLRRRHGLDGYVVAERRLLH